MKRKKVILPAIVVMMAGISLWFHYSDTVPEKIISGFRGGDADLQVFPYDLEHSAVLKKVRERASKYYNYSTNWVPKPWAEPDKPGNHTVKMYPFPLVEGLDRDYALKNRIDINKLPSPKKWEHFGIQGVGVVTSLAIDKKDMKHLLLGTEGSGLYESITFGNKWQRLKFNRNDITHVIIDPDKPKHYIIATGAYLFPDMPPQIYHSQDAGKTWDVGFVPVAEGGGPVKSDVIPIDVFYADGIMTILGKEKGQAKSKSIVQREAKTGSNLPFKRVSMFQRDEAIGMKMQKTGVGLAGFFDRVKVLVGGVEKTTFNDELFKTADNWKTTEKIFDPEDQGYPLYDITAFDITPDGQRLAVFLKATENTVDGMIAKSKDGGKNWEYVTLETLNFAYFDEGWEYDKDDWYFNHTAQDLVLLPDDEDYIGVFLYMNGLFESFDGGQTFSKVIDSYQDVRLLPNAEGETQAIEPMDLRIDSLKPLSTKEGVNYFMPTDQGLFLYQATTARLINVTKDFYLGDSGQVAVSSCPRVYSGLWHVGSYWINEDSSIEGFNGGENWGYGAGVDKDCETPMFSPVHGYLYDGKNVNEGKTTFFTTNLDMGWPVEETFRYHDGWWYMYRWWGSVGQFLRVNDDFTKIEKLYPMNDDTNKVNAYGFDVLSAQSPVWVLDKDFDLWEMQTDGTWQLVNNIGFNPVNANARGIAVYGERIIIFGLKGLFVSPDAGATWKLTFSDRKVWALEQDKCGGIYAAVQPMPDSEYGGVFHSTNDGSTFKKLGTGDNRSYISSLAIDHVDDILYAGTAGESLLRMSLDECAVE